MVDCRVAFVRKGPVTPLDMVRTLFPKRFDDPVRSGLHLPALVGHRHPEVPVWLIRSGEQRSGAMRQLPPVPPEARIYGDVMREARRMVQEEVGDEEAGEGLADHSPDPVRSVRCIDRRLQFFDEEASEVGCLSARREVLQLLRIRRRSGEFGTSILASDADDDGVQLLTPQSAGRAGSDHYRNA